MSRDKIFIALGANLPSDMGPPAATLKAAIGEIVANPLIDLLALSRFYQTPAYPAGSGPDYVNACAALGSDLSAEDILSQLHLVEARLGRIRAAQRWQARGIDLDLLAYGGQVLPDPKTAGHWRNLPPRQQQQETPHTLILPHPRLQDRAFVLIPLADIAGNWAHPAIGMTVPEMIRELPEADIASIRPMKN